MQEMVQMEFSQLFLNHFDWMRIARFFAALWAQSNKFIAIVNMCTMQ